MLHLKQIGGSKSIAGGSSVENSLKWLQAGIDGGAWLTPRSSAGGGRQPTNPSYLGWETKVQARRDAFFTEAQVTVKRRRYNRLHHHPRDTDDAAETTRNTKSDSRSFGSKDMKH